MTFVKRTSYHNDVPKILCFMTIKKNTRLSKVNKKTVS